jgi:uncharacterized Zn finger protein
MYAELNTKSDYCQVCGYDGEIKIVEDDGKLVWECPNCGKYVTENKVTNGIITQDTEYIRNLYQEMSREHRI